MNHLKNLPTNSLASEFYHIQAKLNFPGLIKECKNLINLYRLPDIIDGQQNYSRESWNNLVKKAVRVRSEINIKKEFATSTKLKKLNVTSENLKIHEYVTNMSLRNARTNFQIAMIDR